MLATIKVEKHKSEKIGLKGKNSASSLAQLKSSTHPIGGKLVQPGNNGAKSIILV
jgi:hypothetical protein